MKRFLKALLISVLIIEFISKMKKSKEKKL